MISDEDCRAIIYEVCVVSRDAPVRTQRLRDREQRSIRHALARCADPPTVEDSTTLRDEGRVVIELLSHDDIMASGLAGAQSS